MAKKRWQHRWPISQQVLIAGAATAAKPRPLPISKRENVDLLPDAADAATSKHRHCDVTG